MKKYVSHNASIFSIFQSHNTTDLWYIAIRNKPYIWSENVKCNNVMLSADCNT